MKHPFDRGILFPPEVENKRLTAGLPPEEFRPKTLVIPLKQGIGEACVPVVEPGQGVKAGELVGRPLKEGVPVHCGVSGTVSAVENRPTLEGEGLCVVVENDFAGVAASGLKREEGREGLIRLMQEAGLVGMGGAGFPTYRKYAWDKPLEQVLINGCECEPYLTCDHALMLYWPERVVAGAKAMGEAAGGAAVVICVEDNKRDAIARLEETAGNSGVRVQVLPSCYPQGGERQLIQSVLGREVPAGALPASCGVLVSNVATAAALADALDGRPLTHRIVTVTGRVERPANLVVPVGTLLSELLEYSGGMELVPDVGFRVIAGGPMTGRAVEDLRVPVTKTTAGLVTLPPPTLEERNCIRCGACARVCPARLMPFAIDAAAIAGNMAVCADYHAEQCIACGCCSFICPAKRFLATRVSLARGGVMARRRAAQTQSERSG